MVRLESTRHGLGPSALVFALFALFAPIRVMAAEGPEKTNRDGPPAAPSPSAAKTKNLGTRWAVIFCGHPGDAEHEESFGSVLADLCDGLAGRLGFPSGQILVWSGVQREGDEKRKTDKGSESTKQKPPANCRHFGPATREAIAAGAAELRTKLKPEDTLWVIVVGHAHFDGRRAWFNIPGRDLDWEQFGKFFQDLPAGRQVFFITTPASGYAVKYLSRKGRVVITATQADREVNETVFPRVLATVLKEITPQGAVDFDEDGRITVLDLYLTVSWGVLKLYAVEKNIPTEHALLDDNGDGWGTEVQIDYLEEELGGRAREGRKPPATKAGLDGALAASMTLEIVPEKKPEEPGQPKEKTIPSEKTPSGKIAGKPAPAGVPAGERPQEAPKQKVVAPEKPR
ncbi:MAG: hypothetical protein ACLQNE_32970 [Thermoguttaceae bacterium]